MGRCFVIQPFDDGVFDKRYDDVFDPAIRRADLEPYRVDRDPAVSIPIDEIETNIRGSQVCLAEITTNNPNVWFELGFAIAVPREIILVCSDERKDRFPFDIQHRSIIRYKTESSRDFEKLREQITVRAKAIIKKQQNLGALSKPSPIADTEGLSQHEIVALVTIMQNRLVPGDTVSPRTIREDMSRVGFTDIAVSIALECLCRKGMVSVETEESCDGQTVYKVYAISESGMQWLIDNQERLVLEGPIPPPF